MEPLVYADLAGTLDPPSGGGGPAGGGQGGSGGGGAEPSPVSTAAGGFSEAVQPSDGGGSSDRFSDARPPTTYRWVWVTAHIANIVVAAFSNSNQSRRWTQEASCRWDMT